MASAALRLMPTAAPSTACPGPRAVTWRLAQAIAEILTGARRATQLAEITSPDVLQLLARNTGRLRPRPGVTPLHPIVGSVRISEPSPEVAEACAVVNLGTRYRAIAFRLELADGRWCCTAVRVG
jgi:Family of unknown function (DUF6459)